MTTTALQDARKIERRTANLLKCVRLMLGAVTDPVARLELVEADARLTFILADTRKVAAILESVQ